LKSVNNQNIKTCYNSLISLGWIPIIRHPTRLTPTSVTLIDHIYTNNVTQPCNAHILLEDISNHMPTIVLMNNNSLKANSYIRDTKGCNPEQFLTDLNEQYANLHSNQPNISTNEQLEKFISV